MPALETISTSHDHADMLGAIATLPGQLRDAYEAAVSGAIGDVSSERPRSLVVCGMGGSGVGGSLLAALASSTVPIVPVKGYDLPAWVGAQDAVVCLSYSGNTAETRSCFEQAVERGTVPAAVVTSGGKVAGMAGEHGVPIVEVPAGMQPRAAVGVLLGSLVAVAERLGAIHGAGEFVEQAAAGAERVVTRNADALAEHGSSSELQLARDLYDKVVVVYGAGPLAAVAERWKAQINENGKTPAYAGAYPELDHNEIVGWEYARESGARWALVELAGPADSEAVAARMQLTRGLIEDQLDGGRVVRAEAADVVEAAFELLAVGDYVSVYLALLRGIDPSPVERIESLKRQLGDR